MLVSLSSQQSPPLECLAEQEASSSGQWLVLHLVRLWERSCAFPERSCLSRGRNWAEGGTQHSVMSPLHES